MTMSEQEALEERRDPIRIGVFSGIARRRVVRQRRTIALIAGAGLLLAGGAAVGAAKLVTPTASQTAHDAACYPAANLDEPHYFSNGDEPPYDVVELCQEMWKRGVIGQTPPPTDPNDMTADFPVPDIALCLDPLGFRAGFPIWDDTETAEELCTRLGLPMLEE
jgi:hypothetical protein